MHDVSATACRSTRVLLPQLLLFAAAFALPAGSPAAPTDRQATPRVHAIVNARLVVAPGQVIPRGTIVLRDGIITALGANVAVPADARVWPGDSLTVYPGLIDAFVMPAETPAGPPGMGGMAAARPGGAPQAPSPPRGAAHELASVTPEVRVVESAPLGKEQIESLRAAGFAVAQVAPRKGIVRGQSAVVGLGDGPLNANVVAADAAQVVAFDPVREGYPGSLMGTIAVVRQALLDAKWYREAQALYAKNPAGGERPPENLAWAALAPVIEKRQPALFVADEMLEVLRAAAVAKEAGITPWVVGAGDEYKRAKEIAATGLPLVVPVNFPEAPDVSDSAAALEVSTEELRHWDQAPGNAAVLKRAGVSFALTANGLKEPKSFRANVAKAIGRGLPADEALAAVTTVPARLLGLADRLGTLAPGKIADLTVTRGDLFSEKGKVSEVWVDGNRYEVAKAEEAKSAQVAGDSSRAGRAAREAGGAAAADSARAVRGSGGVAAADSARSANQPLVKDELRPGPSAGTPAATPTPIVMGNTEAWRSPEPQQPVALLVRNATIWTEGPQGILEGADLLVRAGKIAAVGKSLAAPAGALVVDATGKHLAPGIIDEHSHSAILGDVNECTNSVTAEVRIQDVVNSESINIYRQLAGGVTAMHLLHGSCNTIGGQNAAIKCRWGAPPDQLVLPSALTIKLALGENPKESNEPSASPFGGGGRYPQTRGGVEQVVRDAFTRARDYREARAEWQAHRRALPPRRDLQLDALVEVLEGKRILHPHAYRQDEMLMLMRLAGEWDVRVGSFEHTLEGYKIADEMAAHGAAANSFSDWWAYKYEVIDAIPWNGYLMWKRGVTVTYGSDSDELARHLNLEAAKAVKYGGVPPAEALKFVTWNAAKVLGLADRMGSLETGKDADFAVWSSSPLSAYSVCEQTWVDGRKYFDRAADLAGRSDLAREREALLAKAKAAKKEGGGSQGARAGPPRYLEQASMSGDADAVRSEGVQP